MHDTKPPNATSFSLLIRLTLPDPPDPTNTQMMKYINALPFSSKVKNYFLKQDYSCNSTVYGYPTFPARLNVSSEVQNPSIVKTFKYLVDQVIENVLEIVPHATIHLSETFPWFLEGFTCINSTLNCQFSTSKCTYMHSNLFSFSSQNVSVLVIGAIHHDFIPTSFYSSMTLYKLTNPMDVASGIGVASVLDYEQRGSAVDYVYMDDADHFFVVQFAYSCLPFAHSSLCRNISKEQVEFNSTLFVAGRTYAHPSGPLPDSILNDIVLYIVY